MGELSKRGRPPRVAAGASDSFIQGRCTHAEKALWARAVDARHICLGEAVRLALTDWAQDVLGLTRDEVEKALGEAAAYSENEPETQVNRMT